MEEVKGAAPWALSEEELYKQFSSSNVGLSDAVAKERVKEKGYNEISRQDKRRGLMIFLSQFKNGLVLVLIAAAIIAYFLGEKIDSLVILSIILLSSLLGFTREYKAERALRELRKFVVLKAKVLRNGEVIEIDSKEIVPGDIVYLDIGDVIPADIRLIHAENLTTNESVLTGESMPILKEAKLLGGESSLPQDLHNIAFMGTSVSSGFGHGIVVSTGSGTFFGKTAAYLKEAPEVKEFQKNVNKFGNFLLKITLVMTVFVFLVNALLGKGIIVSFLFALALSVGMTPELLPIILTISLSNGALRMAKEKVIVKRLSSVEDLGNIDILCCDKTGTITEGEISLYDYSDLNDKKDDKLILYGLLCNTAKKGKRKLSFGNPIDKAILNSKEAESLAKEVAEYEVVDHSEFDFEKRKMNAFVIKENKKILISKGAPLTILKMCKYAVMNGRKVLIRKNLISSLEKKIEEYESKGLIVIALAEKSVKSGSLDDENGFSLLGFLLFLDPPKKEVKESLELFQKLGVNIKIVSGDSPIITKKICEEVSLTIEGGRVIEGGELEALSEEEFNEHIKTYNIFARITPIQKQKIMRGLSSQGHVVGFLGDGINDAPAIKAADVGISVESATPITKDEADIILGKKSLAVIAHGIREGRKIYGNVTKSILNLISGNFGNMSTVSISSIFLPYLPMLPSQILLLNFITDAPLLTMSTDNVDEGFLKKPKRWNFKLISRFMIYFGWISSIFDIILIASLLLLLKVDIGTFRTSWFLESALTEAAVLFALRTSMPFYKSKPSKLLTITSLLAVLATIAVVYTSFGSEFFGFVTLPVNLLILIAVIVVAYFAATEITKRYFFKKFEF